MAMILVTGSLVVGIVLLLGFVLRWRKIDMPGPKGHPIVGNALQLSKNVPYVQIQEWSKEFGSIFKLQLFREEVVVCNDYESIMMTKSDDFAGRPKSWRFTYALPGGNNGIAFQDFTKSFKIMLKLSSRGLRPYGASNQARDLFNKPIMECLTEFLSHNGEAFNPNLHVDHVVVKFILKLMLGEHVKLTAGDFSAVEKMLQRVKHMAQGSGEELELFPWLRHFGLKSYRDLMELNKIGNDAINSWIDRYRLKMEELNLPDEDLERPATFLAVLLRAYDDGQIDMDNIKSTIFEIVVGGTVTVKSHIESLILLMLNYPEVQERVIAEIQDAIPEDRSPTLANREKLPYTEATVLEAVRFLTVSPLGVPHKTTRDTTLGPYNIPKDTQVWTNLWGAHHDPRYFPDPNTFNPDRFLDSEGKTYNRADVKSFLPFGVGKRTCLGEKIAIPRIFLFFSNMLHRMRLIPADGKNIPSCDLKNFMTAITYQPPPFYMKVEPLRTQINIGRRSV
ncbi:unnamed protein product [Owenia fusiformis]|uniref:Uncharacterized protein n=1 Tax=Owenia fusiformis TaxID=6347 RepID=A0A8J1YC50_OWEFU|nr:unnamed protein product [Owenia fusiformis]